MTSASDSRTQRIAEGLIREQVEAKVGKNLPSKQVALASGALTQVDGVAEDESILVEIFAHQGTLKGGQQKKIACDALKLITLGQDRPHAELILAFADEEAATLGKGWLAEAIASWKINVCVVELDQRVRNEIRSAQHQQDMRSPIDDEPHV